MKKFNIIILLSIFFIISSFVNATTWSEIYSSDFSTDDFTDVGSLIYVDTTAENLHFFLNRGGTQDQYTYKSISFTNQSFNMTMEYYIQAQGGGNYGTICFSDTLGDWTAQLSSYAICLDELNSDFRLTNQVTTTSSATTYSWTEGHTYDLVFSKLYSQSNMYLKIYESGSLLSTLSVSVSTIDFTNFDYLIFTNHDTNHAYVDREIFIDDLVLSEEGGAPAVTKFTIVSKSFWDNSSINNFNATVNGTFYSTTNGTIITSYNNTQALIFNITVNANDYFSEFLQYNISEDLNQLLKQSDISFACYEKITSNVLTCVNNSIYPNAGTYDFNIGVEGYYNLTQEETISALDNKTINYYGFYSSLLTFDNNFITGPGNLTTSCNYTVTGITYPSFSENIIGINGSNASLINGSYNIKADCEDYAFSYENVTINKSTQIVVFDLYTANSIDIRIYDETTGILLNGTNITVTKIFGAVQQENNTATGLISYENLTYGNYTFSFEGTDYSQRSYSVLIGNKTYQTLNVYLLANTTDKVIFAFEKYSSNQVIEGVTLQINKVINGTDTLIAVLTSDITGRTQFYFDTTERYCFIATKSTYTTKEWCLNPIIFTSYTIKLETSVELETGNDYEEILIDFTPNRYWNNQNNTITFTFANPEGSLINYGFNATYNGSTISASGTNAYGGLITNDLEILNSEYGDKVILYYYYQKSGNSSPRSFKLIYDIYGYNATTDSLLDNPPEDYGLGEFEKTLISTSITILVGGASAYFGGALAGGIMALFMFAWLMYIGFLHFWVGIISIILLFIIISWRSSQ